MLLHHSALYFLARGLPGVLSLVAIAVYSRLLTPDAYGQVALVIAGVGLADVLLFQWLQMGLLRLLPAYETQRETFLSSVGAGFLALTGASAAVAGTLAALTADPVVRGLALFGAALLVAGALLGLLLELARIELAPLRYGALACSRAVLSLASAVALILLGLDVWGLLGGMVLGALIPALAAGVGQRHAIRLRLAEAALLRQLIVYGTPLTAAIALMFVVDSSDRFLIAWLLDESAVGRYDISYNFAQSSIGMLLMVVNIAAYPLVVRALEEHGADAARIQMKNYLILLLALGLPATSGLVLLSGNIAVVILGESFQIGATTIISMVGIAVFLGGIKAFYFDLSFQLGRRTVGQLWIAGAAATVNVVLNLFWIPVFGTAGAAYATVAAFGIALLLSGIYGARIFRLPAPDRETGKLVLATGGMVLVLWPLAGLAGPGWLAFQVIVGAGAYASLLWLMNVAGIRRLALATLRGLPGGLNR